MHQIDMHFSNESELITYKIILKCIFKCIFTYNSSTQAFIKKENCTDLTLTHWQSRHLLTPSSPNFVFSKGSNYIKLWWRIFYNDTWWRVLPGHPAPPLSLICSSLKTDRSCCWQTSPTVSFSLELEIPRAGPDWDTPAGLLSIHTPLAELSYRARSGLVMSS